MSIVTSAQPKFMPLLRKVQDLGIVTVHPKFARVLLDSEIKAQSLSEFSDAEAQATAYKVAAQLIDSMRGLNNMSKKLAPRVRAFVDGPIQQYFYARLPDALGAMMALDKAKPNLCLVHNDVEPLNMLLAMWARERHVPCLHIPHAVYLDGPDRGGPGTDIHDVVTSSHIACSGPFQAEWYIARGADPKQVLLTGLPQLDRLGLRTHTHDEACRLLRLDPALPIVAYMSSWRQDTNLLGCHTGVEDSLGIFIETMKQLPHMQCVIKTHPSGNNVEQHVKAAQAAGLRALVTDQHLDVVLSAADFVVSYGPSNTCLEAAAFRRAHIICLSEPGSFPNDPEIHVLPSDKELLLAKLLELSKASAPDYTAFIAKYIGVVDGRATDRIESIVRVLHG